MGDEIARDAARIYNQQHIAGATPDLAKYYPEDQRYLVHRPLHVEHHRIVASDLRVPKVTFSLRSGS